MTRPSWLRSLRTKLTGGGGAPTNWAERPAADAWQAAIDGEVHFWSEFLATKGARYPGAYDERLDPEFPLQPEIAELIAAPEGSTVRLLDVGAGPLTFLGRKDPRWTLDITAVDALGTQYTKLLTDAGVTPPVPIQTCESEKLSTVLPADSFDLVAARNTLDHSYDPALAISEMVECAKPGAALLLVHHRNTAEDEHYTGMHQWNFEATADSLMVWRPGERTDMTEYLAGRASFERSWIDGAWEHVVIRKTSAGQDQRAST